MSHDTKSVIFSALTACGDDEGTDVQTFIDIQPITVICDRLAQKLTELGYRVTQSSDIPKSRKNKNGKSRK